MSETSYWLRRRAGGVSRRRVLGYSAAGISGMIALACGGGNDAKKEESKSAGPAGTVAPSNAQVATQQAGETPAPGGAASIRIATTAPLDPIANTTYTAQTVASFAYSRLMRYKTDSKPDTAD